MSLSIDEVNNALQQWFPMGTRDETVTFEFVELAWEDHPRLVMRLLGWDVTETGQRSIRDIKEQEIDGRAIAGTSLDRLVNYLEALKLVMLDRKPTEPETLMPDDVITFSGLSLATANSVEDFVKALRAKSRLGKHLAAQP